ncbi:MAG: lectin-like protein, partial [Verrucomicrobiota bacterium]
LIRIVPPLVFGFYFIVPLTPALFMVAQGEPVHYRPDHPGHLWFLTNLVTYTILLIPLIVMIKKQPDHALIRGLRRIFPWGLLLVLPLPLALITALLQPDNFAFFPIRFWYGMVAYTIGFLLPCVGDRFWSSIRKVCHPALLLALLLYLGRLEVIGWNVITANHWTTGIESGMWMLAFIGYGSLLLHKPSRLFAYLNKAVFPIYIIHMPAQQLVALWIFKWKLGPELTFLLHVFLTLALCFFCYELVIRRVRWLYPVMGLKAAKTKPREDGPPPVPAQPNAWSRVGTILTIYLLSPLIVLPAILGAVAMAWASLADVKEKSSRPPIPSEPTEFEGHFYQIFETKQPISWDEAKARCEAMGGHLVIIDHAEENDFLTTIGAGNAFYHLGATDREEEGEWLWVDGTPMTYENWHPNEPNDYGGSEDYLNALHLHWPRWNDAGFMANGFVCEWDTPPAPERTEE